MIQTVQSSAASERQYVEKLRAQYDRQGFTFITHPAPDQVPKFLGSYRPDVIVLGPDKNIAIEIKQRRSSSAEKSLNEIRRLFEEHPEWQFVICYVGNDPQMDMTILPASKDIILDRVNEARTLAARGYRRVAFVLSWSILEAALRRLEDGGDKRPRTPGTVVETLAMLGYLSPEAEHQVRPLIALRNRIVHGDLEIDPSDESIKAVLSAIDQAVS